MSNVSSIYDAAFEAQQASIGQEMQDPVVVWADDEWMYASDAFADLDAGYLCKSDDFIKVDALLLAEYSAAFAADYGQAEY